MALCRTHYFLTFAVLCIALTSLRAQAPKQPLKDRELMALVSGGAPSENVAHDIGSRGLAFRPGDSYRALLTTAGADDAVTKALNTARVDDNAHSASADGADAQDPLLQDLATAGKLIRTKQYAEAGAVLKHALPLQFNGGMETAFVEGELLKQQEDWADAATIYDGILRRDLDFPEVHTKLSYILYRTGDQEDALREAKAALAENPENAEAHKNAGLALQELRKFDAAEQEYHEALRIKPDYWATHEDLGLVLDYEGKVDESIAEYKKALALNPDDGDTHVNLGVAYGHKGDLDSEIREYRDAKRLMPIARQLPPIPARVPEAYTRPPKTG
jgi:tetratricopeptide (TPR) repeat protein